MNPITKYWRRWNLQRAYAGDAAAMNRLYFLNDPWGLDTPEESFRFQETERIIREHIGTHFRRILEVGCGEGLQTQYLVSLAEQIVGVDLSLSAVKRARAREIPNSRFEVGDLTSFGGQLENSFDLVTACEVLYYIQDLQQAYERLNMLGRNCLVTYYQGAFARLDAFFSSKSFNFETITGPNCAWRVVYWSHG